MFALRPEHRALKVSRPGLPETTFAPVFHKATEVSGTLLENISYKDIACIKSSYRLSHTHKKRHRQGIGQDKRHLVNDVWKRLLCNVEHELYALNACVGATLTPARSTSRRPGVGLEVMIVHAAERQIDFP